MNALTLGNRALRFVSGDLLEQTPGGTLDQEVSARRLSYGKMRSLAPCYGAVNIPSL